MLRRKVLGIKYVPGSVSADANGGSRWGPSSTFIERMIGPNYSTSEVDDTS